jgi:hypothetical protein
MFSSHVEPVITNAPVYGQPASLASSFSVPDPDVDGSLATKDKDMTRGMGHLLRNPNFSCQGGQS